MKKDEQQQKFQNQSEYSLLPHILINQPKDIKYYRHNQSQDSYEESTQQYDLKATYFAGAGNLYNKQRITFQFTQYCNKKAQIRTLDILAPESIDPFFRDCVGFNMKDMFSYIKKRGILVIEKIDNKNVLRLKNCLQFDDKIYTFHSTVNLCEKALTPDEKYTYYIRHLQKLNNFRFEIIIKTMQQMQKSHIQEIQKSKIDEEVKQTKKKSKR